MLSASPLTIGFCYGNAYCDAEIPNLGTCQARVNDGGACVLLPGSNDEYNCDPGFECVGGFCQTQADLVCP